jgi:hypothetical protein
VSAGTVVSDLPDTHPGRASAAVPAPIRTDDGPSPARAADQADGADEYTWSFTCTEGQARALTFAGVAAAGLGELYLQLANPSNRAKAVGLVCLMLGAMLFGLGATESFLPKLLAHPRLRALNPLAILQSGPSSVGAGVGALAFLTLIARLYLGSAAATDLVLWAVAIAAFALVFVGDVNRWRPPRWLLIEIGSVSLIVLVVIGANARDLNDWFYSAIGDEYSFLSHANGILVDGVRRPFAQDGVYAAHPVLGSVFQAAVMWIFGRDHFGWIMSSVLSHALAIPAVYLVGRALSGRAVGIIAAAMFGFCHYLFAFAHLGYNNIMAQAPTAWSMAFFALYLRYPRTWLLYASGVAAGLGFYTFYSARATIPILGLFVLLLYGWRTCLTPRGLRDRSLELWPLGLGFVVAVAPIFAASGTAVITRMLSEVPGGYSDQITGPPGQRILTNAWINVPAYFYNTHVAHFTSGSLLDPVTAALVALGIGLAIRWRSHAASLLLLTWTVVAVGVTALLSPHPTPVLTRLLFGVPPLALLGALAAQQVWQSIPWLRGIRRRDWLAYGSATALMVLILALNLHRFWVKTPNSMHLTQDAVVVGALRSGICGPETARTILVMRGHGLIRGALNSYQPMLAERNLPRLITHDDLRPGEPISLDNARCVIFGDPNDESARKALDNLKQAHPGSYATPFKDRAGIGTVQVFLPPTSETRP